MGFNMPRHLTLIWVAYYHIELNLVAQNMCTIVLPWGKYRYKRLPMGVANSPDIFQEKMSDLMTGLQFVRTYLDDVSTHQKYLGGSPP
jgi:hypothetical protein